MPPRGAASARRDAEKKRGTLGDDANLGQAAVTRVRELLDRRGAGSRGARGGSGSAPSSRRGAAGAAFGGGARVPSATAADESAKPKRAAKKKASAHNAKILAAASVAADLATNSGKANRQTHISGEIVSKDERSYRNTFDRSRTATLLEDAAGTCGAAAAGASASLDRAAVAAVEADARVAAAAAKAERGSAKKNHPGSAVSLVSVSSSDEDTSGDEWEDVGGDFDAYAPIAEEQEDETREETLETLDVKKKDGNDGPRRRVSPADREALRAMHRTHLLCLLARAAATDAAASDPLVRACAASAAPRGVAFFETDARTERGAAARDGEPSFFLPTADRVARLAKWFAGAFECRAFSKTVRRHKDGANANPDNPKRKRRRTDRNLEPLSRPARVAAADDVIVLDDDDDDDATRNRPNRSIPSNAFEKANDVDVTRGGSNDASSQTTLQATLADACVAALVSPRLRLAFACARRRGTQEDLVGLFVAAARGLGLTARVVAAFDPTPHRASASELARLGVRVGDDVSPKGRRSTRGGDRRRKRKDPIRNGSSVPGPAGYGFNSVRCDPSFFARETSDDDTNAEALARERVTWWAEVLCADETEPSDETETAVSKNARWVPVAPHAAGVSKSAPRWSFRAGAALVDDARALRGASPYVFAFGDFLASGSHACADDESDARFGREKNRVIRATDVTKKYAEAFSRCAEKRGDSEWVAETTRILLPDRGRDPDALVASADARDAREMDARAKTERVPSAMHELKNHPLYACERFLRPNQVIFPRKPVVGFVNGECVFPRSCVSELRSAERWKSEARREVMPEELGKPRARTFSRAARAAAAFAAKRDAAEARARRGGAAEAPGGDATRAMAKGRRTGPRSVEAMARDSREAERAMLDGATADANVEGDIPLFGVWQTREWHPPRAVNGIVPKNARGNVDLIGAHALPPPGTAHVSLPRVSRVARALRDSRDSRGKPKIDFAPALVGFEYRRGGATLPKFDGVVVCAEHESLLRKAWCDAENARLFAEKEKDTRRAKRRWRVLLSAVWTRRALRDEFFVSAKSSAAAIDHDHDATDDATDDANDARRMFPKRDPPPVPVRTLAGPATDLRSGRVAVVAGGAEAEVEEM